MIPDSKALMTRIVSQDQGWSNDDTQLHRYAKQSQWQCVFCEKAMYTQRPFKIFKGNSDKLLKSMENKYIDDILMKP